LSPGDVVEITIYRQPELSREVMVRPDGRITLPLLGDMGWA
jgi:polysaccharide export outer membrane protein